MAEKKTRLFSEYLGKNVDEFERDKKRVRLTYIDLDQLSRNRIYSFLNAIYLDNPEISESARYIITDENKPLNYLSMLRYKNLIIHSKFFLQNIQILQSVLLMCDMHKYIGKFQPKMIGLSSPQKQKILQEWKLYLSSDLIQKICQFSSNYTTKIQIYELPSSEESSFEMYNYLPLAVINKTPHFSHIFDIHCSYSKQQAEWIINPRYRIEFGFYGEFSFVWFFEDHWNELIQLYQQNQILLQSLTDDQIFHQLKKESLVIYKPPTFRISTLIIDEKDASHDTINYLIEYFKWNSTPIQRIVIESEEIFKEWIKNSFLSNHPLILRVCLDWVNVPWEKYAFYKKKLEMGLSKYQPNFSVLPSNLKGLPFVSFIHIYLFDLMQMWKEIENQDIQRIALDVQYNLGFDVSKVHELKKPILLNQSNLKPYTFKNWKEMTNEEFVLHIAEWNDFLNHVEDEIEIYSRMSKELIEFVGWNWTEKWNLNLDPNDIKYTYIFTRKK